MTTSTPEFRLVSDYQMTGDQPQAADKLVEGLGRATPESDRGRAGWDR